MGYRLYLKILWISFNNFELVGAIVKYIDTDALVKQMWFASSVFNFED